jgi:hypothetical protein
MAEITDVELLARYAAGERDFQGVILSGIRWGCPGVATVNLEGTNFTVGFIVACPSLDMRFPSDISARSGAEKRRVDNAHRPFRAEIIRT